MGMRLVGKDSLVVVSYDFEYTTEEGNRVWMKEGEVLLLINKTNADWWQVIRRGDRRPFYAPARYVAEFSQDSGEWDSAFSGEGVHYRPDNGEPLPGRGDQDKKSHFSTFLGGSNKRSSYAAPQQSHHGPPSSDFLFGAPRFQERYRSNSMDSILVADLNRQIFIPKQYIQQPANLHLEKRPTFDNIDKRASWSQDKSQYIQHGGRIVHPVYTNHTLAPVLHAPGLPLQVLHGAAKKPVPLPRSKIPVPTKSSTMDRIVQPDLRTFKRSKTDLSLGMLSNYKQSRAVHAILPTTEPSNRNLKPPGRRPSTNRSAVRPAAIREEHDRISLQSSVHSDLKIKESLQNLEKGGRRKSKPDSKGPVVQGDKKEVSPKTPPKPVIKEKPCVPVIKANLSSVNSADKELRRINRAQSENDLINRVPFYKHNTDTQTIDSEDELKISLKVEGFDRKSEDRLQRSDQDKSDRNSQDRSHRTSQERSEIFTKERSERRSQDQDDLRNITEALRSDRNHPERSGKKEFVKTAVKVQNDSLLFGHELSEQEKYNPPPDQTILNLADQKRRVNDLRQNQTGRTNQDDRTRRDRSTDQVNNDRQERSNRDKSELSRPRVDLEHQPRRDLEEGSEGKENLAPQESSQKPNNKFKPRKETNEKFLDMEPLPEPPPTPPRHKVTPPSLVKNPPPSKTSSSPINIPENPSQPLVISTEPMSTSSSVFNKSEDKSNCSSSFDSLDGSLDSSGWPEGGDWLGAEPNRGSRGSLKSPNNSTCSRAPVSPVPGSTPLRHLFTDWDEYQDTSGRKFYYNLKTGEKSFKPPRRIRGSSEGYSAPTSPDPFTENGDSAFEMSPGLSESECRSVEDDQSRTENTLEDEKEDVVEDVVDSPPSPPPPSGYEIKTDSESGEKYYVNIFTGVSWYSAADKSGRVYYYEENGNESCWELPNVSQTFQDHSVNPSPVPDSEKQVNSSRHKLPTGYERSVSVPASEPRRDHDTASKTESLRQKFYPAVQIGDVSIVVLKQGTVFKTRLEERGKKYRKNWSASNLVLTDTFLLFYKDAKAFANLQAGGSNKPDQCIDLKGAQIEWCNSDKSKRLNVFEICTLLEQKLLLQDDDFTVANDWFSRIENVIVTLSQKELVVRNHQSSLDLVENSEPESASSTLQSKKKVGRTKSLKLKLLTSNEELSSAASPDSPSVLSVPLVKEKSRIREKLRKFFLRRPGVEDLMKRGIMKNEPVFGSTLTLLARQDHSDVPIFVKKCVQVIESKPEYLSTDGVYRQSGNLSTVQRLRLQVDHGNPNVLETVDDIHVLTGALKLFFRELKEPLIPWELVDKLINVCNLPSKKGKAKGLKDIVSRLSPPHHATLIALLRHLDKVTGYKEVNRMAVSNLAIVFGPTLMWPPANLTNTNMALNMMQQNMIVEALITNLSLIC